jgi:hypothetical protein
MFRFDTVFAPHEKFGRAGQAKACNLGSCARIDAGAEAKLLANAEIAKKDVPTQYFLVDRTGKTRYERTICAAS